MAAFEARSEENQRNAETEVVQDKRGLRDVRYLARHVISLGAGGAHLRAASGLAELAALHRGKRRADQAGHARES